MRNSTRWTVALLAAGALGALLISGGARAQDGAAAAKPPRIAVLNLGDCLEASKNDHAKDLEAQFNVQGREVKETMSRILKSVDELRGQLKTLEESSPGSALYLKIKTDLQMEEARFEITKRTTTAQLVGARDTFSNQLYAEARKMAHVVAQEMKIDLVLRGDDGAFVEDKSDPANQTSQRNLLRSVLYFDPSLDITSKVLSRLNEEYRKKKPVEYTCPKCNIKSKEPKCPKCGEALKN